MAEKETGKYWEVQFDTVVDLKTFGYDFNINDRLEPFKLVREFTKPKYKNSAAAKRLLNNLVALVTLRRMGYEPEHKNNKYG